ncbi:vWA domain-containing protein [Nocardioides speluncae]|uniref:vWA domain-containing protein n=1 Tax=Nocardioides speluncae TaxID=2670337 RepID=UPI000D69CED2|nr:VWA domain-containing protein [Nocardioides speluncae]
MTTLPPGGNTDVPATELTVTVRWSGGSLDASALLVTHAGRVRSDADFVFYNQPEGGGGSVRHLGGENGAQRIGVRLPDVPDAIDRLVIAASADDGTLAGVSGLAVSVADGSEVAAEFAVPAYDAETVAVLGEFYRRAGGWKFRAIGQGYTTGLAGLATDYGVTVDDEPDVAPPAADLEDPDVAGLPVNMAKQISLRKETVRITLEKKGIPGVRARVAVVLDRTGSMRTLYAEGVVARIVERLAPVAATLDDDGSLDAWAFADDFARLPSLRIPELPDWITQWVYINASGGRQLPPLPDGSLRDPDHLAHARGGNNEPLVITDIIDRYLREPGDPVLVIFFSDGGVNRTRQIRQLLVDAAQHPIFWQFVGLGRAEYGILERLDTMPGRLVDNAGFFAVDDIETVSDAELYDRLLEEFPSWLEAARQAGVIRP